jgi:hypothetical protein
VDMRGRPEGPLYRGWSRVRAGLHPQPTPQWNRKSLLSLLQILISLLRVEVLQTELNISHDRPRVKGELSLTRCT